MNSVLTTSIEHGSLNTPNKNLILFTPWEGWIKKIQLRREKITLKQNSNKRIEANVVVYKQKISKTNQSDFLRLNLAKKPTEADLNSLSGHFSTSYLDFSIF